MARHSTAVFRSLILSFFIITLCAIVVFYQDVHLPLSVRDSNRSASQFPLPDSSFDGTNQRSPETSRLDLNEQECRTAFPGLFADIDDAISRGSFPFKKSPPDYKGLVQGRIKDNKLHILSTAPDVIHQIWHQRTATLSQIHRSLLTSPTRLPDTHFAFVINDSPKNNSWAFARPNKPSSYNIWLMPSFAFWSWPSSTLGAYDDVLSRIDAIEEEMEGKWDTKIDKVVWRGTPWFNPIGHPTLRQDLLKAARRKEWADVEAFNMSSGGGATNALRIEDFCRYKYVVYTEGVTYSGRLPYHQACQSVLLTAPLTYLTHSAWLMKPILANDLLATFGEDMVKSASAGTPSKPTPNLLPTVKDWRDANAVYVSPDFANLEDVVLFLSKHPDIAQSIARNQRELVASKQFLSTTAETCYWRGLIRGWANVAQIDDKLDGEIGERFETWLLSQVSEGKEGAVQGRDGRLEQ